MLKDEIARPRRDHMLRARGYHLRDSWRQSQHLHNAYFHPASANPMAIAISETAIATAKPLLPAEAFRLLPLLMRRPAQVHHMSSPTQIECNVFGGARRNKLNVQMHSRKMTQLTNAFSKKSKTTAIRMALHFVYYNFCRVHHAIKINTATRAGITKRLCGMKDIVDMLNGGGLTKSDRH
jgi:hypothetical protein